MQHQRFAPPSYPPPTHPPQFTDPSGLAVDAAAGVVWVSDRLKSAASLFKFSATTGEQLGRYFPQNVLLDPPFSRQARRCAYCLPTQCSYNDTNDE